MDACQSRTDRDHHQGCRRHRRGCCCRWLVAADRGWAARPLGCVEDGLWHGGDDGGALVDLHQTHDHGHAQVRPGHAHQPYRLVHHGDCRDRRWRLPALQKLGWGHPMVSRTLGQVQSPVARILGSAERDLLLDPHRHAHHALERDMGFLRHPASRCRQQGASHH